MKKLMMMLFVAGVGLALWSPSAQAHTGSYRWVKRCVQVTPYRTHCRWQKVWVRHYHRPGRVVGRIIRRTVRAFNRGRVVHRHKRAVRRYNNATRRYNRATRSYNRAARSYKRATRNTRSTRSTRSRGNRRSRR